MKTKTDTASHTPKELLTELHSLVTEAEKLMGDSHHPDADGAISTLRSRFSDAQERFSDFYENARKKVVAGAKSADGAIRENPYPSIAIAAGVGLLVGMLLGRRNK